MNEGPPTMSWIWMAFPLVGLAVNLFWPRKRSLKAIGLILLLLSAYLQGFTGLNPLDRNIGVAERILTGQQTGTPENIVDLLHVGQTLAHQTMFDVSLALMLGVVFAATPADIITRIHSCFSKKLKSKEKS